ncbi:MAG: epoxyqueuosine reductase [Clostridia bacterium]|nr:epoxyqueuosine reductase [Clostridia bacterium]
MLKTIFEKEQIEIFGVLPFSACNCRRPDLIERKGVCAQDIRSAIVFLIPYYVQDGEGNISLYARSGDYHFYCDALFARILPELEEKFGGKFLGFADKSPIEENIAAAKAGLGVLGDNYMLINEKYGSFVFLAEILSTVSAQTLGFSGTVGEAKSCLHCGACKRACPALICGEECLSSLTQKKGALTLKQEEYIRKYGSVWGCDLCQLACPLTQKAVRSNVQTQIPFFKENRISVLTEKELNDMSPEAFRFRAFSWRGKAPLLRNLSIVAKKEE